MRRSSHITATGGVDYAEVEVHVNGGLPPGTYRFSLAENGMRISFSRGISAVCFDTRRFWGVMGIKYSESSSCVMAFNNSVQAMYRDKVIPDAGGQYWGAPQVIQLREKCTGTPVIHTYPYRTSFKIEGNRQNNTLAHCRVQLAVQRISRSAPTHSRVIDLFDIQSSQESHDRDNRGHPPPPTQRHNKKRKSARYADNNAVQRRSISNEDLDQVDVDVCLGVPLEDPNHLSFQSLNRVFSKHQRVDNLPLSIFNQSNHLSTQQQLQ